MRWMNVFLAASVLISSSWIVASADPGDGEKFGFDENRLQLAQAMNQTQEPTAPDSNVGAMNEAKLVPGKALLLSAILPGAGQYYAKSPIMAGVFLALEIGAWTGVAIYHKDGMDKEGQYIAYANAHWTYYSQSGDNLSAYLNYEYWAASSYGRTDVLGDEYNKPGSSVETWMELSWDEKLPYLPENGFTHELEPDNKDQQYYEMIGKYNQFYAGWPASGDGYGGSDKRYDTGVNAQHWTTGWNIKNSYRETYLNLRKDSNDALEMSKNFTMVVLVNHLASALHAGFSVSWHNRRLAKEQKVEGAFRLEPRMINQERVTMGTLRVNF